MLKKSLTIILIPEINKEKRNVKQKSTSWTGAAPYINQIREHILGFSNILQ